MSGENPITSGLTTLLGILNREKRRGGETIALGAGAENALRSLPLELRSFGRRTAAPLASPKATKPTGGTATIPPQESGAARSELPSPASTASSGTFVIPSVPDSERTEAWRREQLNAIFKAVKNCSACRELGTLFETVVFATGNPQSDLMFVGEAPGFEEEQARKPFVGPSGEKLDQILKAMGLSREVVYLTNIMKFRPKKGDGRFQGATSRPPQEEEMAASLKYIRAEIEVVRPRVIVALGRTAAEGLLERGGNLATFRKGEYFFQGIPLVITCHPEYLLRQESDGNLEQAKAAKRAVWEDMLKVMDLLGMPVTEKQRGYFA
ncbi:MAG: uracil-DNA glycosylase [Verrucomicrobiales bacterium]|nr:uracil-DNA glycosylase [Verrucomicrobiales bacterium]